MLPNFTVTATDGGGSFVYAEEASYWEAYLAACEASNAEGLSAVITHSSGIDIDTLEAAMAVVWPGDMLPWD